MTTTSKPKQQAYGNPIGSANGRTSFISEDSGYGGQYAKGAGRRPIRLGEQVFSCRDKYSSLCSDSIALHNYLPGCCSL